VIRAIASKFQTAFCGSRTWLWHDPVNVVFVLYLRFDSANGFNSFSTFLNPRPLAV